MPDDDFFAEGFDYLRRFPGRTDAERETSRRLTSDAHWRAAKDDPDPVWVVRFDVLTVTPYGIGLLSDDELRELAGRLALPGAVKTGSRAVLLACVSAAAAKPGRVAGAIKPGRIAP